MLYGVERPVLIFHENIELGNRVAGHHFSLADAGRKLAHARQAADRLVLGAGYKDTGLVVVDALGRPMRPSGYSDRFVLLCRDAGVRQVHLHAVRHTLALMMHRAGIAPADAAALLGHTVQTHLTVYVPLTEKGARTAASGLGAAIAAVR